MGFLVVEELHLALVALARLCVEFSLAPLVLCLGEGEREGKGKDKGKGVIFIGFAQLDVIMIRGFSFSKINGFIIIN